MLTRLVVLMIEGLHGVLLFLGDNHVSWSARKQATKLCQMQLLKLLWIQSLLKKLSIHAIPYIKLWRDNMCSNYLTANMVCVRV
jgi:hypothetical protein